MLNNFPVKQGGTSRRASSFNLGGNSVSTEIVERPLETTGRAKLKYVQMEIAEKEACALLKTLCQDAARHLHKKDPEYHENFEVQDLLTGILLLGNMSKRMAVAMNTMEETMHKVKEEYVTLKTTKEGIISQLESVILKLRDDKVHTDSALIEVQIKNDRHVGQLNKEIANLKEEQKDGHTEVHILKSKIASLERKVMEIPRMEERYLRTARGIVRQQEAANTVKEVEFKKIEEDVKSLQYWKNKASNLEEILLKQNSDVENYAIQARSSLAKYQTLLNIYNTEKRTNKSFGGANVAAAVASSSSAGGATASAASSSGAGRPGSAPALRRSTTLKINDITITSRGEIIMDDPKAKTAEAEEDLIAAAEAAKFVNKKSGSFNGKKSASFSADATNNSRPSSGNRSKRRGNGEDDEEGGYRTLEQIQAIEIAKLKRQLAEKEEKLTMISRKLALARAYPLFNVTDDTEDLDGYAVSKNAATELAPIAPGQVATAVGTNNRDKFGTYLNKPVPYDPKGSGKANIRAFFYQIDQEAEHEQETPEFIEREERLQNERFARAIAIEEEYQNRIMRVKDKNPPHIAAIRKSLSFAKTEEA